MGKPGLGSFGMALNVSDTYLDEAAELERLGYSAIWLPGGQIGDLERLADLAGATSAVAVGSAIISLDVHPPESVTGLYTRLEATAPGRLVAGLGGPQHPRPLQALNDYLDHLDQAVPPLPARRRLLAALGPRKLGLARDRCAGAILLLVSPARSKSPAPSPPVCPGKRAGQSQPGNRQQCCQRRCWTVAGWGARLLLTVVEPAAGSVLAEPFPAISGTVSFRSSPEVSLVIDDQQATGVSDRAAVVTSASALVRSGSV